MTSSRPLRRARRAGLSALCAAALVLPLSALSSTATAAPADPGVPRPAALGPAAPGGDGKEILRERSVRLDPAEFRWLCGTRPFGTPREQVFPLFPDLRLRVVEDRLDRDGPSLTWTGHVHGRPDSNVVLSATGVCEATPDPAAIGIDAHFDVGDRVYRISMVSATSRGGCGSPRRTPTTASRPPPRTTPTGNTPSPTRR
ncbi:hypothetical protein RB200_06730 [Streptomyces sp. PmtG]